MRLSETLRHLSRRARLQLNRRRGYGLSTLDIRVPLDRSVLSPPLEYHLTGGENQAIEVAAARAIIEPNDTVLELGAGLGVVSAALRKYTAASRIVAFEPNPDLLHLITVTHALNGVTNIEVRHGVVKSNPTEPTARFYRHVQVSESSLTETSPEHMRVVDVPVFDLQKILDEINPQVLLADIEGGEVELFGAAPSLGTVRSMAVELHQRMYGCAGVQRLFNDFARLGFAYDANHSHFEQLVLRRV